MAQAPELFSKPPAIERIDVLGAARGAEYSLTESAFSPFQAEPAQIQGFLFHSDRATSNNRRRTLSAVA